MSSSFVREEQRIATPSQRLQSFALAVATFACLAYVHLWVVEGALRKWVPGLGQVLYVARDGLIVVAILTLAVTPFAGRRRLVSFWLFAYALTLVGVVYVIGGLVTLPVALAGIRSYVAPLLLIVLYVTYRPPGVWRRMVRVVFLYTPLQLALAVTQVLSPPTAWINREVSGDVANFVQDGIVRASGTFSSPSGLSAFTILAFALALGMTLQANTDRRTSVVVLPLAVMLALVSGSRGTIFGLGIVLSVVVLVSLVRRPSDVLRLIAGLTVALVAGYWIVSGLWPTILAALMARFELASQVEDTSGRVLDQTLGFLGMDIGVIGIGPGAASLAGIALGSGSSWVEVDSMRWVTELGLLGALLGLTRLVAAAYLAFRLLADVRKMAWPAVVLIAVVVPVLLSGSITQNPTTQAAFGVAVVLLIGALPATDATARSGTARGLPAGSRSALAPGRSLIGRERL